MAEQFHLSRLQVINWGVFDGYHTIPFSAGGALIGWFLDRLFGTSPWLLLVLLFLGFAVAIRNIYRISQQRPE